MSSQFLSSLLHSCCPSPAKLPACQHQAQCTCPWGTKPTASDGRPSDASWSPDQHSRPHLLHPVTGPWVSPHAHWKDGFVHTALDVHAKDPEPQPLVLAVGLSHRLLSIPPEAKGMQYKYECKEFLLLKSGGGEDQITQLKNGKGLEQAFLQRHNIQMANRHVKKRSPSLIARETQIQTTVRRHLTSVKMTVATKSRN